MKTRRLAFALTAAAAAQFGGAAPAHALSGVGLIPSAMALLVTGDQGGCANPVRPALGTGPAAFAGPAPSKASAILGGKMSQLELIARQQAGTSAPLLASRDAKDLPGKGITPGAGGAGCLNFALPTPNALAAQPGLRQAVLGPEDFLASKRLNVKRTSFDASWNRVRGARLARNLVPASFRAGTAKADMTALATINSWTNHNVRYVEDQALYGQADYWASAGTTLQKRAGDCEDIAIAKMHLLARLGVPRSSMYLTVARDMARNADHAMLVVKLDGRHWLLDNATDQVLDASASYDYRPIMSFSQSGKWLHGY